MTTEYPSAKHFLFVIVMSISLYTRDKAVMRKLDTLVVDFPDIYKMTGHDEVSKTYSFPKSYISYRKPRIVSTEQKERASFSFEGTLFHYGTYDYDVSSRNQ